MLNNINSVISRQLQRIIEERKLKDVDVLKKCGFTRPTLIKIKNGGNINVETLAALANGLGVKISYFLDEPKELRQAGRDYVERGNIEHNGGATDDDFRERIAELKSQLADKERIIKMMEEKG